ncbi:MAG: outer membrane beta-barrel protein [Desulfuromonadaceae bacterium]|nr:outer membrane beta-barrel protein [Desulfuromonadaceae bacterium]MDD4129323.1 outer membrane beta-barrel protein [Desulfuromonadaceae bacterium]
MFAVAGMLVALSLGLASMVHAEEDYKKFGVRVRAIYVAPNESFDSRLDGVKPTVSDSIIPELDLEYFFMKNLSTELILAVTKNDIKFDGDKVGSTWLLPPTFTVKFHPLAGETISPYVGVGVNYTMPFNSNLDGTPDFNIDNSVGWAAQAGVDVKIKENIYLNFDYKYVKADTKITVAGTKYTLDLNPNLFGIGVGYRF